MISEVSAGSFALGPVMRQKIMAGKAWWRTDAHFMEAGKQKQKEGDGGPNSSLEDPGTLKKQMPNFCFGSI
jgi:hypothetical protein